MRIWTELEIAEIGGWPVYGPFAVEKIERILRNQNDIIEELQRVHKLLYHSDLELENGE